MKALRSADSPGEQWGLFSSLSSPTRMRGLSPTGSGLPGLRLGPRSPGPGEHRLFEEREVPGDPAQAPLFSPLQPWQGRTQRLPRPPLAAKGPSQDLKGEFLREVRTQGRPSRQGLASLLEPLQTQCGRRGKEEKGCGSEEAGDGEVELGLSSPFRGGTRPLARLEDPVSPRAPGSLFLSLRVGLHLFHVLSVSFSLSSLPCFPVWGISCSVCVLEGRGRQSEKCLS